MPLVLAFALATTTGAVTPAPSSDLAWLAGYWRDCSRGREVSETWTGPRNGILANVTLTSRRDRTQVATATIRLQNGVPTFFAVPDGQPPAAFPATSVSSDRVVFENLAHDYPQRVIYERRGTSLHARIEDAAGARGIDWRYEAAPLNSRCSAPRD